METDVACKNCRTKFHFSSDCPLPQKNTRCPGCHRVVGKPSGHSAECDQKEFVSVPIVVAPGFAVNVPIFHIHTTNTDAKWSVYGQAIDVESPPFIVRQVAGTVELTAKNALLVSCEFGSRISLLVCDHMNRPLIFVNASHTSISVNNYWTAHLLSQGKVFVETDNTPPSYSLASGTIGVSKADGFQIKWNNRIFEFKSNLGTQLKNIAGTRNSLARELGPSATVDESMDNLEEQPIVDGVKAVVEVKPISYEERSNDDKENVAQRSNVENPDEEISLEAKSMQN